MNNHLRRLALAMTATAAAASGLPAAPATAADTGHITVVAQHNTGAGVQPIAGAVFTIGLVADLDPTTAAGRAKMAQYASRATDVPVVRTWTTAATGADGRAEVSGLPDGAYLVHESGLVVNGVVTTPTTRLQDFIISLPTLDDGQRTRVLTVMPKPVAALPTPTPTVPQPNPTVPQPNPVPPVQPAPGQVPPQSTRINSGDGANFDKATQWALVVCGLALVAVAFLGTRRRREAD